MPKAETALPSFSHLSEFTATLLLYIKSYDSTYRSHSFLHTIYIVQILPTSKVHHYNQTFNTLLNQNIVKPIYDTIMGTFQ